MRVLSIYDPAIKDNNERKTGNFNRAIPVVTKRCELNDGLLDQEALCLSLEVPWDLFSHTLLIGHKEHKEPRVLISYAPKSTLSS